MGAFVSSHGGNREPDRNIGGTRRLLGAAVVAAALLLAGPARASIRTWTAGSAANWNTAANWSGSAVPVAGDAVVFDTADGDCSITAAVPKLASITINSGYAGTISPDTQSSRTLVLTGAYAQNCTSCT